MTTRTRFPRPLLALAVLSAAVGLSTPSGEAASRAIRIDAPRGGWTSRRVVAISGTLGDRATRRVELTLNGTSRFVNSRDGRFQARLPLRPGPNAIEAAVAAGRDRIVVHSTASPTDLQILLTWDTPGTDLDLHVTEPSGEECYYGNRRTLGGGALEVDDVDGFGPEIFMLPKAPVGAYRIAVSCYDARQRALTEARVEVVMREGTPHERHLTFPVALTREDETLEVATVFVDRPRE